MTFKSPEKDGLSSTALLCGYLRCQCVAVITDASKLCSFSLVYQFHLTWHLTDFGDHLKYNKAPHQWKNIDKKLCFLEQLKALEQWHCWVCSQI